MQADRTAVSFRWRLCKNADFVKTSFFEGISIDGVDGQFRTLSVADDAQGRTLFSSRAAQIGFDIASVDLRQSVLEPRYCKRTSSYAVKHLEYFSSARPSRGGTLCARLPWGVTRTLRNHWRWWSMVETTSPSTVEPLTQPKVIP